jgi:pyruvate,water dikinase
MLSDRWIVDRVPTERFPDYTRGNAAEVLGDPVSPLGWTFCWESGLVLGCRDGFVTMGIFDADEYSEEFPETFGLFGGYFYNSLTQARLFGVRSGAGWQAVDNAYFDDPSAVPPYVEQDWHQSPRHSEKLAKTMAWVMSATSVPTIDRQKRDAKALRDSRPDLATQSTSQLLGRARSVQGHLIAMFAQHVFASLGASVGPGVLTALAAEVDPTMVPRLIAGVGDVDSALIADSIWDLSRLVRSSADLTALFDAGIGDGAALLTSESEDVAVFRNHVAAFIYEHGSRGPSEWDLYSQPYETRPQLLFSAIDRLRRSDDSADPRAGEARAAAERERLTALLEEQFAGNDEALGTLHAALKSTGVFMAARERCKSNNIRALHEIRMCFDELGQRMVEAGHLAHYRQIYMLLEDELDDYVADPASFTDRLAERESDYLSLYDLVPPYSIQGEAPPLSQYKRRSDLGSEPVAAGDVLKGIAGAPGVVTGTAKVLLSVDDPTELDPGDILIAPSTDPAWTPLFLAAGAVIVNVGAVGTHAVIVSRELGIPCVPSVADATKRIPSGAVLTVDGNSGTVKVESLP